MEQKNWIEIKEENCYDFKQFVIPTHYKDDLQSVIIPYGLVQDRTEKLAHDIAASVSKPLIACCILKGAHEFFADLTRSLKKLKNTEGQTIPLSVEFVKVKSYENTESTGDVKISLTDAELREFKGKDILIVEDIVDTGNTMIALIALLKKYEPNSIKVASLLLKRTERSNGYEPDFVGFSIPDLFVIGYGIS